MSIKIHFYIRPQKAKKNGEAPIYLRLTGNKRKEHSIGYSIIPSKWDAVHRQEEEKKPGKSGIWKSKGSFGNLGVFPGNLCCFYELSIPKPNIYLFFRLLLF